MLEKWFDALGHRLSRGYRLTFAIWICLAIAMAPFALKLSSTLVDNNVTLTDTPSYKASEYIKSAFPEYPGAQVVVVVTAPSVIGAEARSIYEGLTQKLAPEKGSGNLLQLLTPLDLYRDTTTSYAKQVHGQLFPAYEQVRQGLAQIESVRAQVRQATGGQVPPEAVEQIVRQQVLANVPADQRQQVEQLLALGPSPSTERVMDAVIAAGPAASTAEKAVWKEILQLGASPSAADFGALANRLLKENGLEGYPIPIPADVKGQMISSDGKTAIIPVTWSDPQRREIQLLRTSLKDLTAKDGEVKTYVTGQGPLMADLYDGVQADSMLMDIGAMVAIIGILWIFFRSPLPMGLTMTMIGLAIVVARGVLYWVAQAGAQLMPTTLTIMMLAMLGAGVDYSIILSERYQQERRRGHAQKEAVAIAAAKAGESVFFSGTTVLFAFGALLTTRIDWMRSMGWGGVVGILTVLFAALTLTPAMLNLLGDRFFWPARPRTEEQEHSTRFARYMRATLRLTVRRPGVVTLLFLVPLIPAVLMLRQYNPETSPISLSATTEAKSGYETMVAAWGEGRLLPVSVAVKAPADWFEAGQNQLTATGYKSAVALGDRLAAVAGVDHVLGITAPFGTKLSQSDTELLPESLHNQYIASQAQTLKFDIVLAENPYSSEAKATVERVEKELAAAVSNQTLSEFHVGGATAFDKDYKQVMYTDFGRMVLMIGVSILLVLTLMLRSIITPIRLILTIILGNIWAIALVVWVFQHLRGVPVVSDVPIFVTVLMMGLGMDYEIFLVTRVRENVWAGMGEREAIEHAVMDTGRVINGAGIIMAATLSAMMLSGTKILQAYGLALGFSVLVDATVIRMYLVPATMLLLKRYNWWFPFAGKRRAVSEAAD